VPYPEKPISNRMQQRSVHGDAPPGLEADSQSLEGHQADMNNVERVSWCICTMRATNVPLAVGKPKGD
jgi:hypothetical protein